MYQMIRVACASPLCKTGNPAYNGERILEILEQMEREKVELALFPELSLSGYSCGDLFSMPFLAKKSWEALETLVDESSRFSFPFFVGLPVIHQGECYDCMAGVCRGELLGLIPRPSFSLEEPLCRTFSPAPKESCYLSQEGGEEILLDSRLCFREEGVRDCGFQIQFSVSETDPEEMKRCREENCDLILCPTALPWEGNSRMENEARFLAWSSRGLGLVVASSRESDSARDLLFSGEQWIVEGGKTLRAASLATEKARGEDLFLFADIDLDILRAKRQKKNRRWGESVREGDHRPTIFLSVDPLRTLDAPWERPMNPFPFVPTEDQGREEILRIQAAGLAHRIQAISATKVWLGISGGLDSCLALLVCRRAFLRWGLPLSGIHAITMPAYGTGSRTHSNAKTLCESLGVSFQEISLKPVLDRHFADIGLSQGDYSTAFENAQARERTQILLDLANKEGGLVVGTGDLSEIALGWCTFNGDQMSNYGVNGSIPKTLARALVRYEAEHLMEARSVLLDIVATPISPELLPPKEGEITQKTEELIGSYELHDYFLYYFSKYRFSVRKLLTGAKQAFGNRYPEAEIKRTLCLFFQRFLGNQFKRAAMPDGIGTGPISLSPRGGLVMGSDLSLPELLEEIDSIDVDESERNEDLW